MATLERYYAHDLSKFLSSHKGGKGNEAAICGIENVKGSFNIPDDKYDEFFRLLYDYLYVQKGRPINLVEQPRLGAPKPILIDLDFKFPVGTTLTHQFQDVHISKFIGCVKDGLLHFFQLAMVKPARFFVSMRPSAYADGKKCIKDGIHIQCPDICLTNEKQRVLREWLLSQKAVEDSFDGVGFTNSVEDIYDESMVRKQGWFCYGESKANIPPYEITNVYQYDQEEDSFDEVEFEYTPLELMKILSVRHNLPPDGHTVIPEKQTLFDSLLNKGSAPKPIPPEANALVATGGGAGAGAVTVYVPAGHDDDEVELSRKLTLGCLSATRAESYNSWMEVGWCLSNISPTDDMFNTWVEFSKKSPKAAGTDWGSLQRKWSYGFSKNTSGSKLSMRSLHYWARNDSPDMYKEIVEEDYVGYIQYNVDDTHYMVAKALKKMYKDKYCASVERRGTEWYVYDEKLHTWRHTNQGMELRSKLSSELADLVNRARDRLKKKGWDTYCQTNNITNVGDSHDNDWFANWKGTTDGKRFELLLKVEKKLYTTEFKNSVMKEAAELFSQEDFTNLLNMNPYIIACKNGVLDLNTEVADASGNKKLQVVFRPGKPDDYMSFLAGRRFPDTEAIDYIPYDPKDRDQKDLMEFLEKIFPEKSVRDYFIRLMSSTLEGTNKEQCYYTFLGVGGNGKSKLIDLMTYAMGDYCSSLQSTVLTRKKADSGAANPDIICIKNKRFIYLQEPDDKEPLNTSLMKQFSGEDLVEARGLFEDQQRFRITGKLFMMCNKLPPIHSMDRGTWRRIRVLLFGSKFVDNTDPEYKAKKPNVFLKDESLDKKLRHWREAWFSLLVHTYKTQYLVSGLNPVPEIVMQQSNKYKESFDQYGKFKAERMVDFRDPRLGLTEYGTEQVNMKEVQLAYNNWVRANEGILTGKKLTKQELQHRLDEDFGNLDGGIYKRVVVFVDDDGREDFMKERMATDPGQT